MPFFRVESFVESPLQPDRKNATDRYFRALWPIKTALFNTGQIPPPYYEHYIFTHSQPLQMSKNRGKKGRKQGNSDVEEAGFNVRKCKLSRRDAIMTFNRMLESES